MESLLTKYGKRGLSIYAVNVGQRKEEVKSFTAGLKVTFPILLDSDKNMAGEYDVISVPRTFILDRNGLIRYKIVGVASTESMNKLINSLL